MTQDIIIKNRDLYIKEFKATGWSGVEHIISYLDSHHFVLPQKKLNGFYLNPAIG